MIQLKHKKILKEIFSFYFIFTCMFSPLAIGKDSAPKVDTSGEVNFYVKDLETGKLIICPRGHTCSLNGVKGAKGGKGSTSTAGAGNGPLFRAGPVSNLGDILADEEPPNEDEIPFDALPEQKPSSEPNKSGGQLSVENDNKGNTPRACSVFDETCQCNSQGCDLERSGVGSFPTSYPYGGSSAPQYPHKPDNGDKRIARNKERALKNKKQFKNDRELHEAFVNTLNDEQTYRLVHHIVNKGAIKWYKQFSKTTEELRFLNPYPAENSDEFYNEELRLITIPQGEINNLSSYVSFHNKKLTEYLKQAYDTDSAIEAEEILRDYTFIEDELKLKGVIDAEGKVIAPNVKQPDFLLKTDSKSYPGRIVRNIYNEHIVNKSIVNTYCGMGVSSVNTKFCEEFQSGHELTDLAIYALDNAIVNSENITADQIEASTKKIQSSIDYSKKLSLSFVGQLEDSGKELIEDIIDAPEAIADAVYNYDQTLSAIVGLYDNRDEIFEQIGESLSTSWNKIQNGTPEEQGKVLGKVGFEVAMMFVAPLKLIKGVKTIKKAKDLAKAGEKLVEPIIGSAKKNDWNEVFENIKPAVLLSNGKPNKLLEAMIKDKSIPADWNISKSKKGYGLRFSKPGTKKADEIRVKEGVVESKHKISQKPNVRIKKDGKWRDINGNVVPLQSEASHIPLEDFSFPDWM